ncbi:MAG: D-alanine--D-alanine ligase [Geodermatophilaceae bacterium]|nr:D-alanine--D-alanine ligase [Geodermatophilaceae bacterium]
MSGTSIRKTRVAVFFGGRSPEHAISCVSAGSILGAIDRNAYEVIAVGIARDGRWLLLPDDAAALQIQGHELPEVTTGQAVALSNDPAHRGLRVFDGAVSGLGELARVDVVFPVLHGEQGEDGTIQGLFEIVGLPYVGAGVFASAAAMDKEFTKKLLAAEGLPTGPYVVLRAGDSGALDEDQRSGIDLPAFVKPARAGSSIGITKISDWSELEKAVRIAREVDSKVLIEAGISGREIECGILADAQAPGQPVEVRASVPAEIRVVHGHDWYDFEAKYLDDACEFDIPADLPDEVTEQIQDFAVRAFRALNGRGLARVDFFVTDAGAVIINEVNTMPGFTPISMYPRMWAASGVPYPELIDRLIRSALTD